MSAQRTLFFTAPRTIEIRETELPPLKHGDVRVESICSAISAGTELLVYRGQFPRVADAHDSFSSDLKYPLAYGYACVGHVTHLGEGVPNEWMQRLVFAFHPHASAFVAQTSALIPIPESITPDQACFLPTAETAVNFVQDGAPILGERVLVLGQGVIGLLTASLLAEFPLEVLVAVDPIPFRRDALKIATGSAHARSFDGHDLDEIRDALRAGADLTLELSGAPAALNDAIACTAFGGRILIGSWYGEKRAEINLGGSFHRSRIRLIASQVSTIGAGLSACWDKPRRFATAWRAIERIGPQKWITHRFGLDAAARAYQLLDENPQDALQVVIEYS